MSALLKYKCPNCGGSIEFDSASQNMKCPYCDTEFSIDALEEYNAVINEEQGDQLDWSVDASELSEDETRGMNVYTCGSCGGQIVTDGTTAASACPYCDNPIIMTGQLEGALRPDIVIPFKIDKRAAEEALKNHLKGKYLLPKSFSSENRLEEIKGVYVPFWLYDCDAEAHMRYRATRVHSWTSGSYQYTETSYYLVTRDGIIGFDKVPADGSTKMPDDLSQSVEPYDYRSCEKFNTAYLSGYMADKYDVDAEAGAKIANNRIRSSTESMFRNTVKGYSSVTQESSNIRLQRGQALYALLPIWVLSTNYKGRIYRFAMNGQTGKFVGDLPMDTGKFWRTFAAITAVVTGIIFFISKIF